MTWEIVLGIATLLTMGGTIITFSSKLTKSIASLEMSIKALNDNICELKQSNKEQHKEFYHKLDNHEGRLMVLENKGVNNK